MLPAEIRRRLSKLIVAKDEPNHEVPLVVPSSVSRLEDVVTGGVLRHSDGEIFVSEPDSDIVQTTTELAGRIATSLTGLGLPTDKTFFLDLETCGLANCPLFLVGILTLDDRSIRINQYFARDYSEEKSLLGYLPSVASKYDVLVTFNGRAFDIPYLHDRMALHRIPYRFEHEHFDLLLGSRRLWRGVLPDCRLETLGKVICGRQRFGDVSGEVIPELYHSYVRTGNAQLMGAVFRHNAYDLLTMAELITHIASKG